MKHLFISAFFLAVALLFTNTSPAFAGWFDQINDMSDGAGSNIGLVTKDSVVYTWNSMGCTVFSGACKDKDGKTVVEFGALDSTNNMVMAVLTRPPVHTATYVADALQHTGLVKQAYAQGVGFTGLSPVLNVWKAFRNLAYFLYIIIFVIVGFMIMFRQKISSQAVMTIQEALPRLIVTLILITFSYAIAGFVIDLMYLSIFIVTGLFGQVGLLADPGATRNVIFGKNIVSIGWSYLMGPSEAAGVSAAAVGQLVSQVIGGLMGWLTSGLAYLIIAVAILIAMLRTLFTLITAYIAIILSVIFAPLQLLLNAVPGQDAFNKWLRDLIANAALFPAAATMLILGAILTGISTAAPHKAEEFGINPTDRVNSAANGFSYSDGFIPPLIQSGGLNNSAAGSVTSIQAIIGLGVIMLLPEMLKQIKEQLQVKGNLGAIATGNTVAGLALYTGAARYREQQIQKLAYKRQLEGDPEKARAPMGTLESIQTLSPISFINSLNKK